MALAASPGLASRWDAGCPWNSDVPNFFNEGTFLKSCRDSHAVGDINAA